MKWILQTEIWNIKNLKSFFNLKPTTIIEIKYTKIKFIKKFINSPYKKNQEFGPILAEEKNENTQYLFIKFPS